MGRWITALAFTATISPACILGVSTPGALAEAGTPSLNAPVLIGGSKSTIPMDTSTCAAYTQILAQRHLGSAPCTLVLAVGRAPLTASQVSSIRASAPPIGPSSAPVYIFCNSGEFEYNGFCYGTAEVSISDITGDVWRHTLTCGYDRNGYNIYLWYSPGTGGFAYGVNVSDDGGSPWYFNNGGYGPTYALDCGDYFHVSALFKGFPGSVGYYMIARTDIYGRMYDWGGHS